MIRCWICGTEVAERGALCDECAPQIAPRHRSALLSMTPEQKREFRGSKSKNHVGTKSRRAEMIRVCVAAQNNTCALCGREFHEGWPATLDHIEPRSRGGTNARKNLQAAHKGCNGAKGSLTMREFVRHVKDGRLQLPDPPMLNEKDEAEDADGRAAQGGVNL